MHDHRDDASEDWRTIAHAASVIASRYSITMDEAAHVLDFEASLFGVPLVIVARVALSAQSPHQPMSGPPDHHASDARDQRRPTTAADRAARRWARPAPEQRQHTRRADLAAAIDAAVRRPSGVSFADALGGRRRLVLDGEALSRYLDEGGLTGALGGPISERRPATPGPDTPLGADQEVAFTRGTIYLDSDGNTKVVLIDDEFL